MISPKSKIKNALRPYFNYKRPRHIGQKEKKFFWKEFQSLRTSTNDSNLKDLYDVVEGNPNYPFEGLGNTFPKSRNRLPDSRLRFLQPLLPLREFKLQISRILHHRQKIIDGLKSISHISESFSKDNFNITNDLIVHHRNIYGDSLILAKKEFFLALKHGGPVKTRTLQSQLTANNSRTGWGVLMNYVYDNVDPAYEVGSAGKAWQRFSKRWDGRSNWVINIAVSESLTAPRSEQFAAECILRTNALSLLDLCILLFKIYNTCDYNNDIKQLLRLTFENELSPIVTMLDSIEVKVPDGYLKRKFQISETEVYRTSYFFDEYKNVSIWRFEINKLMSPEFNFGEGHVPSISAALSASVSQLLENPNEEAKAFEIFQAWTECIVGPQVTLKQSNFLTSLLVARIILENHEITPIKLVTLLTKTPDAINYISTSAVKKFLQYPSIAADALASFVVWDVLYRKDRNPDNELERRSAFMDIFFGGSFTDIVPYIDSLYGQSPQTASMLSAACSRSFLERLYLLMTSVKDVIEARLAICLWSEDKGIAIRSTVEERKALQRELANLDARSDLDSTRIHVDEEYLREWFNETQKAIVNRYIETAISEGSQRLSESILNFYQRPREPITDGTNEIFSETQIGSDFILVRVFDQTLQTFARDKNFGLDSYLSRRIRHGTLSGNILTPINRIVRRLNDAIIDSDLSEEEKDSLINKISKWENELTKELDRLRSSVIQIKSDQAPDGLIRATWKLSTNLTHLDAMVARVKKRVIETSGEYDLFSDIHSLCWDCIEPDLANLRLHMTRSFLPIVINSLREVYESNSLTANRLIFGYFAQIELALQARIQEICGWFIRPVFRRDEYELLTLINSSFSIIKELDVDYDFDEVVDCDASISLNRGGFEVLGDVLFVLLGNAAKHGSKGDTISVAARVIHNTDNVEIKVTSSIEDIDKFRVALERANEALSDNFVNTSNAAVQEGFSGLKKLRSLLYRLRSEEYSVKLKADSENLSFTVSAILPLFVSFKKERT